MRKKLGLRKTLITGAMSVALVAGGTAAGAAIASGPVDGAGLIHGCYGQTNADGTTHGVVLQNAGTTCPASMTSITWNQTGPQGPAGATGPAGPAGADGKTVLNGTGAPAASVGSDGDFYTFGTAAAGTIRRRTAR